MIVAPLPANEKERIAALREYRILDTLPEQAYDDITYLASRICETPIALVSLVDEDRQWFKSKQGLDAEQTPREHAFCAHAIHEPQDLFEVPDATRDQRFARNPLVTGDPHVRFYAGAPLTVSSGHTIGTLCVIDRQPRKLDPSQRKALAALSRQVVAQLDLRMAVADLTRHQQKLEEYQRSLEQLNADLTTRSRTDALTGLANRAEFERRLDEEFYRAQRHGHSLALFLMDIDYFKSYNDKFGHPAGDELLSRVGRLLKQHSRVCDFVGRYGGEEFAAILPETVSAGAGILAERFRRVIESEPWDHGPVTLSVGVAVMSDPIESARALLDEADRALYEAKRSGRNRVVEAGGLG